MKVKRCCIYGQNGLDLDIVFNLAGFYRRLGFSVTFGDKVAAAELLVIVRGVDRPLDLAGTTPQAIHVFDYVGHDYDALVKSIDPSRTLIFCTSEAKRQRLITRLGFPVNNIHLAFPPVEVDLWARSIEHIKYEVVHIGNHKPAEEVDPIRPHFLATLKALNAHIWGLGWTDLVDPDFYHGKLGLFDVAKVYAQSGAALGFMYPFQRNVTFSSRFWLAPLNGCVLISEPGLYTRNIPGVIECEYSQKASLPPIDNRTRKALQDAACAFWREQNESLRRLLHPSLASIPRSNISIRQYTKILWHQSIGQARRLYQRLGLFRLFGRTR